MNRGGRPNRTMPKLIKERMQARLIQPTWESLAALFGTQHNNGRKLIYTKTYAHVERFIVAAELLGLTPRELLDTIQFTQRVARASKTKPVLPVALAVKPDHGGNHTANLKNG